MNAVSGSKFARSVHLFGGSPLLSRHIHSDAGNVSTES